jgi:pimeloyl-ACP methyl ester carboxylesterase
MVTLVGSTIMIMARDASADPAAATAGLTTFYQQKVVWAPCAPAPDDPKPGPGDPGIPWEQLDCTTITVPLNYRQPSAGTLKIAVSRIKATGPASRKGVLLINPGGPGGGGLIMPLAFQVDAIAKRFDLIGFDPRGVGRSTRLLCEVASGAGRGWNRPTEAQMQTMANDARRREQACQRAGGGIRPFINTANTARDMDVIRAALGEKKINYLGFSYGTYLGAVYGSLFPTRLNRSVLDSSVHPKWVWHKQAEKQAIAANQNVDALVAWVAKRNKVYGLGSSVAAVNATLKTIASTFGEKVVEIEVKGPHGDVNRFSLDQQQFDAILGEGARFRDLWDVMGMIVKAVRAKLEAPSTSLSPDQSQALHLLAKLAVEETTSGVFQTVTCEVDWPRDLGSYYVRMRLFAKKYPYGQGAISAAPTECTFRSFTPPEKPVHLKRDGYPAGLVIQADGDSNTHYDGGPAMANALHNNLISVRDAGNHGLYGVNECVTKLVDDYLIDGALPASRSECAGVPRPNVPEDAVHGAAAAPRAPLEAQVRAFLSRTKPNRF